MLIFLNTNQNSPYLTNSVNKQVFFSSNKPGFFKEPTGKDLNGASHWWAVVGTLTTAIDYLSNSKLDYPLIEAGLFGMAALAGWLKGK